MASKSRKSKFFRVATEGATTDGRKIEKKWIQEIAATYDPLKYGARIFIEHIRGFNPNSQGAFRAMGDVLAVEAREVEGGKLALFAQIDPTDEMVKMNNERQKIYTSIEVVENFAGSGMAYLYGLGVTDSPASLGSEILAFASQNPAANPFSARKNVPESMFSEAEETVIELEPDAADPGPSLFSRITDMFKGKVATDDARFADVHGAVLHVAQAATENATAVAALRGEFSALQTSVAGIKTSSDQAVSGLAALVEKIDHTPNSQPRRPAAPGGNGVVATDC